MLEPSLPLAFLNHPAMLGWLAAAAAPLIIHLLNKRKYREVPWAAMQYLMAAIKKNSRRLLIEQWLLLAVRTLIIVLLVLAMAEPFLEQTGLKLSTDQRSHKVLVLDASFSMAYKPTDRSRFDRAKELARLIVEQSSQGDGFTLVLLADPPRVVVGRPAFQPRDFLEEIENITLPHGGADLPATLAKVQEILAQARQEHKRLTREEVLILTDLGRNTWMPDLGGDDAVSEFRQRSTRLGARTALMVVDLGQADSDNLAVTSLRLGETFATVSRDVSIEAEIQNFGRQERVHQLVELYVDDRRAGQQTVDFEAGGQASVHFPYRFETPGDAKVEVRVAADLLDIDNHRWLSVPVKEQLRVLCVNGKPAGGSFENATDYLVVALSPQEQAARQRLVQVDVVTESALVELELSQYDCVFLANVGQFTSSEAGILEDYARGGGGLVFFLGDQVRAESYNRQLYPGGDDATRVLPAALGAAVAEAQYRFDPLDYRHPLLAAFRGQERAGLLTTPVYQYFQLDASDNAAASVALAFDNGDPMIVEHKVGHGRAILVATSADISWTTMPVWPSYVPLVQELLNLAVSGQLDEHNATVGHAVGGSVRQFVSQLEVSVRPPDGEPQTASVEITGDATRWSFDDTHASGAYLATLGPPVAQTALYAVNVGTAESDLAKLEADELSGQVWPGVRFVHRTDWQDLGDEPEQQIVQHSSLHQILLVMLLGLLLGETFLAWMFGRRAATT